MSVGGPVSSSDSTRYRRCNSGMLRQRWSSEIDGEGGKGRRASAACIRGNWGFGDWRCEDPNVCRHGVFSKRAIIWIACMYGARHSILSVKDRRLTLGPREAEVGRSSQLDEEGAI